MDQSYSSIYNLSDNTELGGINRKYIYFKDVEFEIKEKVFFVGLNKF